MSWSERDAAAEVGAGFANLHGSALVDNPRVLIERLILQPGRATGTQSHTCHQLMVFIRGGLLAGPKGRATLWNAGRVQWFAKDAPVGASAVNIGTSDIEIVCVNLKPLPADSPRPVDPVQPLNYPNIPGEDLIENDLVIVQRFVVQPGEWEGVHGHQPNTLYVHIRGGQWAVRSRTSAEHLYPEPSPDGEAGWMEPIDADEGHESGNVGSQPIELIWVTLRQ